MEFKNCPICGHPIVEINNISRCLRCMWNDSPVPQATEIRHFAVDANAVISRIAHQNLLRNLDGSKTYCMSRGISEEDIERWELGYIPSGFTRLKDFWERRILFPIRSLDGESIVGFSGRKTSVDDRPKYVNSSASPEYDKSKLLYGGWLVPSPTDVVYLCEGNIDVISMAAKGYAYPVASCGTAFTAAQAAILRGLTNRVIIAFDNDEAGQKGTRAAVNILRKAGFDCSDISILVIDGAKDVDECLHHGGSMAEVSVKDYFEHANLYGELARMWIW